MVIMTNIERVRRLFASGTLRGATNADILRITGISPHQQVYQLTQKLVDEGFLRFERRGREKVFSLADPPGVVENGNTVVAEATRSPIERKDHYSEDDIRNLMMEILYQRIGKNGSWQGQGKNAAFALNEHLAKGKCTAEKALDYHLPTGDTLSHRSDILIEHAHDPQRERADVKYISIEIKHRSAVTDQFKCRAFDMLHLNQTYGPRLQGVMVFVRANRGISFAQARKICYPFDHFFGIEFGLISLSETWNGLARTVSSILQTSPWLKEGYRRGPGPLTGR